MKKILLGILVLLSALTQANAITTREQCNSKINSINSSIEYLNRQRGGPCQWSMYVKQILDNTDIVRKHCWSILDEDGKFWIRSLTREMKSKPMCGSDYHSKYTPRGYWSKTTDLKPKLPSGLDIEGYDRPIGSKPTQKEASNCKQLIDKVWDEETESDGFNYPDYINGYENNIEIYENIYLNCKNTIYEMTRKDYLEKMNSLDKEIKEIKKKMVPSIQMKSTTGADRDSLTGWGPNGDRPGPDWHP
jgi:hypothetical protein